jgi:2-hydroxychromene-2-carboxylate isomerase
MLGHGQNHALDSRNDPLVGHAGVSTFVFNNEPFFGPDRMNQLVWRLKRFGLTERDN